MHIHAVLSSNLEEASQQADELREQARRLLVESAADAHQAGMTQREIAAALNRSQPEVSRLLKLAGPRFRPRSPLGRLLVERRAEVLAVLEAKGVSEVRVFGSVARGEDDDESDIDLLVAPPAEGLSLMEEAGLQIAVADVLGIEVDVVSEDVLRPKVRERALREAVAL